MMMLMIKARNDKVIRRSIMAVLVILLLYGDDNSTND